MIFTKSALMFAAMFAMFSVALIGADHPPASESNRDKTGTMWVSPPQKNATVVTAVQNSGYDGRCKSYGEAGLLCFT